MVYHSKNVNYNENHSTELLHFLLGTLTRLSFDRKWYTARNVHCAITAHSSLLFPMLYCLPVFLAQCTASDSLYSLCIIHLGHRISAFVQYLIMISPCLNQCSIVQLSMSSSSAKTRDVRKAGLDQCYGPMELYSDRHHSTIVSDTVLLIVRRIFALTRNSMGDS